MTNLESILSSPKTLTIANIILLTLVCILVFIVPIFPLPLHKILYNSLYTGIFLIAVIVLEKYWKTILSFAIILIFIEWFSSELEMNIIAALAKLLNILFFIMVVIFLIIQIAKTKKVTFLVIVQAINGYLLLGIVFTFLVALIMIIQPEAYSFPVRDMNFNQNITHFSDYIYYSFVTFTTLGYGDVVPQLPYSKSLAIFTSVTGQIYVAVIIAMLVGKFASVPVQN